MAATPKSKNGVRHLQEIDRHHLAGLLTGHVGLIETPSTNRAASKPQVKAPFFFISMRSLKFGTYQKVHTGTGESKVLRWRHHSRHEDAMGKMSVASNIKIASKYLRTNDGVRLHYLEAGAGKTIVLVHGISQTAEQFKFQIEGLADRYRVIALDLRGHGESEKPNFGLKIHRLAQDLREALVATNADDVTLLGHSMGCSVIWAYWELFGADRLGKIVLI